MSVAQEISQWSKDPSTKVGAIVVGDKKDIRSTGFNSFPRNIKDDDRYNDIELKYKIVIHAEMNACLSASRLGVSLEDCTLYSTLSPCSSCSGAIIQSGITRIVVPYMTIPDRWKNDLNLGYNLFKEAGVKVDIIDLINNKLIDNFEGY